MVRICRGAGSGASCAGITPGAVEIMNAGHTKQVSVVLAWQAVHRHAPIRQVVSASPHSQPGSAAISSRTTAYDSPDE